MHAILHEPASYTVDRNRAVYDKMGITYSYIHSFSEAKTNSYQTDTVLDGLSLVGLLKTLKTILSENDIVIMNGYTGKVFRWLFVLNLFYKKSIGLDSDTPLNIPESRIKRFLKKAYLGTIFRNRHVYGLAGGTKSHRELFSYYGMSPERIFLMPMMVDNKRFISKYCNKSDGFRFLYIGRIVEVKNIPQMIESFIEAVGEKSNVELKIVGGGDMLGAYKDKYGENKNIIFAGPKYDDELIAEYHGADALILPSSFEPWGLVVNEALSAGLPVIVSDQVGAAYDLVEKPETGLVFKFDDKDDLADKMKRMVSDKEFYQWCSHNAVDLMQNHWNYDFYRECLLKFIQEA